MRIIHTTLRYPPATGGVERYVQDAVNLSLPQHDVRVLTSRLKTHGPLSLLPPTELSDDMPHIQRLHHMRTPLISYPRLQALSYYLGHHKPNVIHGHGFWYHPADGAARFAQRNNIPFIFNPYFYENPIRRKPLWQLYKHTIGRATFRAADVVVGISEYEKSLIEAAGLPTKNIVLIPPGIDTPRYAEARSNPFTIENVQAPVLLSVGRLANSKGVADGIRALPAIHRDFPQATYVIIGEDFGAQAALQQLAHELKVADRVHFWGKASTDTLIAAFQHAAVFIHPSQFELFGIVVAEAMAAGTPVVVRKTAALPEVVAHGEAGLLFETPEELAEYVITLVRDDSKAAHLIAKAKQRVNREYSYHALKQRLEKLYGSVV